MINTLSTTTRRRGSNSFWYYSLKQCENTSGAGGIQTEVYYHLFLVL